MASPTALPDDKPQPIARSLTGRTVDGFVWMFCGSIGQALLRIAILAVLARLLTPTDFGIISAALTVVALAEIFGQIGVAPAVIQISDLTRPHVRTGFAVSLFCGLAMAALMFASAPWVAAFFQISALEPTVQALSTIFLIRGFAVVAEALLQRHMRFRTVAIINLVSYGLGYGAVAIALALSGYGIWALVYGQIAQGVVAGIGFIACARHEMMPVIQLQALLQLVRFGFGETLSRLGNYVALNADQLVVGRWLGAEALGLYSRAYVILMQPANLFGAIGDKVLFPALATIQSDQKRVMRAYYRSISMIALVTLPLTGILVVFASEIIDLLLGGQWTSMVIPFQILVLSLFFRTAYKITATLLRARGFVYWLASWQWIYAAAVLLGAWIGQRYGLVGVAAAICITIISSFWIGLAILHVTCGASLRQVVGIVARHGLIAVLVSVPLALLKLQLVGLKLHYSVILTAAAAATAMLLLAIWLFAGRLLGEEASWARAIVAERLPRRFASNQK
jgi:O-antigen/teichoic acid export membrane protein